MSETNIDGGFESTAATNKGSLTFKAFVRSRLVMSALAFILALTVLLLMLFAPLAYSGTALDGYDIDIEYTGMDAFLLLYHSMLSRSEKSIENSQLYKQTLKDYLTYLNSDEYKLLSKAQRGEILSNIAKNRLFISLESRDVDLRLETVLSALVISIVLLICTILLIYSFASLSKEIMGKFTHKKQKNSAFNSQLHMLWLLSMLLFSAIFCLSSLGYFGKGTPLSSYSANGCGLSYGIILALVFSSVISVYSVFRLLLLNSEKQKSEPSPYIKKLFMLLLVFVILISAFMPVVSMTFYKGGIMLSKTEKLGISVGDIPLLSESEVKYHNSIGNNSHTENVLKTCEDIFFSSSDKSAMSKSILSDLIIGVDKNDVSPLFAVIKITVCVLLFIVSVLIVNILRSFLLGEHRGKAIKRFKILAALLAMAESVLSIVLAVISMLAVSSELSSFISVSFGMGPTLLFISAILLLFMRAESDTKSEYADSWYDNADVTYAPYVVKKH